MKYQPALRWLIPLIGLLALIAAAGGLFWTTPGAPFEFTTLRGETVMMHGRGLYRYDSVSGAAQEQAQDAVTLFVTLPVLVFAMWWAFRGSLRGRLLLTGTIGYFLYTYASMAFLTAYNEFFLIYVALFSLSLYAFILSMLSFDLDDLPSHFSERLPRRAIAGVLFALGAFLLLAWLGRIVPPLLEGTPPFGLESTTTLVIQVMDLGLIVPLAFLAGILLLRRSAWGYLLTSVAVLKFLTFGAAVSAMAINLAISGAAINPVEMVVFPLFTLINVGMAWVLLRNVDAAPERQGRLRPA